MGTQIEAHGSDPAGLDEVRAWFLRVEECCSRFRPDSELSLANARAGEEISLSPLLADVLAAAAEMKDRTGGLVDPGVGKRVAAWGYDRTFHEVVDVDDPPLGRGPVPSWSVDGRTLRLGEGTRLDLGGIAKGWAADRAVEMSLAMMVSAGGDLRSADPAMQVDVKDVSGGLLACVALGTGGLATSSTARRRWVAGGREVSHLIDPRTGGPVESPVVSATVTAATALEAEAGAKAVVLLGSDGLVWAERQPWLRGAMVEWEDGFTYATTGLEAA